MTGNYQRLGAPDADEALADAIQAFLDGEASGAQRIEHLLAGIPLDRMRTELRAWFTRFVADDETRAMELLLRCTVYQKRS